MSRRNRIQFLQTLVAGSVVSNASNYADISRELIEVNLVQRVRRDNRRQLLELFHLSRAFDSTLSSFTRHYGCTNATSLGGYLKFLRDTGISPTRRLSEPLRMDYRTKIVDKRNEYMHKAGKFPAGDQEIVTLLSNMESCLSTVFAL